MPAGHKHTAATLYLIGATGIATGLLDFGMGGWVIVGECVGLVVTPDLDLTEARRGKVGLAGAIWRLFWWPYGKAFGHRGLSHAPILGTATRLLYLAVLIGIAEAFGVRTVEWLVRLELGAIIAGLMLADLLHVAMDALM